jgi:hypothetical protein
VILGEMAVGTLGMYSDVLWSSRYEGPSLTTSAAARG